MGMVGWVRLLPPLLCHMAPPRHYRPSGRPHRPHHESTLKFVPVFLRFLFVCFNAIFFFFYSMIFSRQHLFFSGARFPLCEGLSLKDFFLFFSCNAFLLKWNFRLQRGWPVPSFFFSCVCGWRVCHLQVRGTAAKNPSFVRMDCRSMWYHASIKKKNKKTCVTPCELWCLGAGVKLKPEPSPSEARGRLHGLHDCLPPPPRHAVCREGSTGLLVGHGSCSQQQG